MPASYPTSAKSFTTKSDGAGNTILAAHVNDLQLEVTAVEQDLIAGVPVARGGTGNTTLTANRVLLGNGTSAVAVAGAGTAGMVLVSNGASAPTFKAGGSVVVELVDGATPALDASLGTVFRLTAAGNREIAVPSNAVDGQKILIRHKASGGARTLTLNTGAGGFRFNTDIAALTATESGKTDLIGCIYDGTDGKWDVAGVVKGITT